MLNYPVRLASTPSGKVRATFLDIPEAVAEAATDEEALYQAKFALEHSLANYVLHDRPIPTPSDAGDAPTVSTDKFSVAEIVDPAVDPASAAEAAREAEAAAGGGRY